MIKKEFAMAKKVIRIDAHIPIVPDWLKINNTATFSLPLKSAKDLAKKLLEVDDKVDIEINFVSGKEAKLEVKYESENEET
jgi:hypothetical protein